MVVEARVDAVEHGERPDDDEEEDHDDAHGRSFGYLLYKGKSSYS